jgi:hypothetical protein
MIRMWQHVELLGGQVARAAQGGGSLRGNHVLARGQGRVLLDQHHRHLGPPTRQRVATETTENIQSSIHHYITQYPWPVRPLLRKKEYIYNYSLSAKSGYCYGEKERYTPIIQ